MERTVRQAVFELLTALPETEEGRAHGSPVFKVSGKTYAYWTVNHHGDGRLAVWLGVSPEEQAQRVGDNPGAYFVPPYVGVKGFVGLDLGAGLPWREIIECVVSAWRHSYPSTRPPDIPLLPVVAPPNVALRPEDINPMLGDHAQSVLRGLAERIRRFPETTPEDELVSATWRAGKRAFVRGRFEEGRLRLLFLVGTEQQAMMLDDARYSSPPYYGPGGWIEVDVHDHVHWPEIESLLDTAYRRVALKRMLARLDEQLP